MEQLLETINAKIEAHDELVIDQIAAAKTDEDFRRIHEESMVRIRTLFVMQSCVLSAMGIF